MVVVVVAEAIGVLSSRVRSLSLQFQSVVVVGVKFRFDAGEVGCASVRAISCSGEVFVSTA